MPAIRNTRSVRLERTGNPQNAGVSSRRPLRSNSPATRKAMRPHRSPTPPRGRRRPHRRGTRCAIREEHLRERRVAQSGLRAALVGHLDLEGMRARVQAAEGYRRLDLLDENFLRAEVRVRLDVCPWERTGADSAKPFAFGLVSPFYAGTDNSRPRSPIAPAARCRPRGTPRETPRRAAKSRSRWTRRRASTRASRGEPGEPQYGRDKDGHACQKVHAGTV